MITEINEGPHQREVPGTIQPEAAFGMFRRAKIQDSCEPSHGRGTGFALDSLGGAGEQWELLQWNTFQLKIGTTFYMALKKEWAILG